jgi:DNA-binding NtrC family response regulator
MENAMLIVIENENINLLFYELILTMQGHGVHIFRNFSELLPFYFENYQKIDILILDTYIPETDLKMNITNLIKINIQAKIILINSGENLNFLGEYLMKHISAIIEKPVSENELLKAIENIPKDNSYIQGDF